MSEDPPAEKPIEPAPKDAQELIQSAVDRAHRLTEMMRLAEIPPNDTTVVALTIVAATNGLRTGLSLNDAFALYLSIHEAAQQGENEHVARTVEAMKNSFGETVARMFGIPLKKESVN
jgi:hypothetical protein